MFSSLSDKQKQIVFDRKGLFAVRACPGSGKTFSVAAKLTNEIEQWNYSHKGIATVSFTNVAWEEIRKQIIENSDIKEITSPHFLGTLDAFINKYLVFPFGHLIMGCSKTPQLVGEPYGSWHAKPGRGVDAYNKYFDKVSININDQVVSTVPTYPNPFFFKPDSFTKLIPDGHMINLKTIKIDNWKRGFFTQADASYIALKLLSKHPMIAKILANRFPYIIIDEAQDTSEMQMAIIDSLLQNGLGNLMMVGDPDQAIFEWNNAHPELFKNKYDSWKDNSIILNENRRSTQILCNFTHKLSSLSMPSQAIASELLNVSIAPIVYSYDSNTVSDVIESFRKHCVENEITISPKNVAIIYRGNSFCSMLTKETPYNPAQSPWIERDNFARDLVKGKFCFDNINAKYGFELVKKCYIKAYYQENSCSESLIATAHEEIGYRKLNKKIYKLISTMPDTKNMPLEQWVKSYNSQRELTDFHKLSIDCENGKLPVSCYFSNDKVKILFPDMTVGTIHSVKGETFEAVLIFLKQKSSSGTCYRTLIGKSLCSENEEMRIVYVGMTRPRRLLMLAVPEKDRAAWSGLL